MTISLSRPLTPITISDVLRAAARLLVVNGLWKGEHCPDPFDWYVRTPHSERPLSVVAALKCAAAGDPHLPSALSVEAVQVLAARLLVDGEGPLSSKVRDLETHVDAWGDVEGRMVESVVAVLEAAADANEVSA